MRAVLGGIAQNTGSGGRFPADDGFGDLALGAPPFHCLLFDISMRLRLGHGAALDQQAFCAVDCADVLNALLQTAVFCKGRIHL